MTTPTLDIDLLRRRDPEMTERFMTILRRYARRYFRSRADAEVVAVEAIVELFVKLEDGDQPITAKLWALNAASNAVRRELTLRRRRLSEELVSQIRTPAEQARLSEIYRCRELLAYIDDLLLQMPPTLKHALIATRIEGRTNASVAEELGLAAASLRKEVLRTRGRLRKEIDDREKLDRLRELARCVQARRDGSSAHPPVPTFARPGGSDDDSSVSKR